MELSNPDITMAEETENRTFGPQPYQFGQDVVPATPAMMEESGGGENVSYDKVTTQGTPDNPRNAQEVVERGVVNVANPQHGRTATSNSNPDTAGSERKIRTLQDMIDTLEPLETPEQRKKRERREKSAKIISAVSDGISALSNLYFTSQYAPNMYNHEKSSQLNAQNAAIEKARKDRESNRDAHLRFALALGDAENERAKTAREIEAEQERRKLAREKAEHEAEEHGWKAVLQPDIQREQAGKADKAEQEARIAEVKAQNAPAMQQAELETEKARKGSYEASAGASRASAANSYASATSHNNKEFVAWDENGRPHRFKSKDAAEIFARQHGTWEERDETSTSTTTTKRNPNDKTPKSSTRTTTKKGGYAGKPSSADNTPPSRRNKNDNTPPSRR